MEKAEIYGYDYHLLVDYDSNGVDNILDIHKHLMTKHNMKQCLR